MSVVKHCRVCLSECDELTPLWVQLPGENKTLKETIQFVVNINIKLEDGIPDKICKTCESVLDLADTFKQRCLESESILERQAQEKQSDECRLKYHTHDRDTYSTNSLRGINENCVNIYDLPEYKIKMEVEEANQENLHTLEYEVPIEHGFVKEEFPAQTIEYMDDKETFCCPHCSLTFQTKLLYKVHILCIHSSFIYREDTSIPKKPKMFDMHPTTATEDPAATDTSTTAVIGTECDYHEDEKSLVMRKISKDIIVKKESAKDTATVLKLSGTKTDNKSTCATEKQSECSSNTVIGTTGDILTCDICGYTTARVDCLNSHLKAHAAAKQYSCNSCLYLTVKLNHLTNHIKTHSIDKPYSCDVCKKSFAQSTDLNKHIKKTHNGEKRYTCDVCEKGFHERSGLLRHTRTHTGDKRFVCNVCEKRFTSNNYLVIHLKTHTGEKVYTCDECKKKFTQRQTLIVHLRSHTGEKPYSCDVCGKKFSLRHNLVEHARIHTGDKPYSCNVCEKKFSRGHSLVIHTRTHSAEKKRYSCDVCERKYSHKNNLAAHVRRSHGTTIVL